VSSICLSHNHEEIFYQAVDDKKRRNLYNIKQVSSYEAKHLKEFPDTNVFIKLGEYDGD